MNTHDDNLEKKKEPSLMGDPNTVTNENMPNGTGDANATNVDEDANAERNAPRPGIIELEDPDTGDMIDDADGDD